MFPSIPRFVSGSTDGGIESKGPTTNPVTGMTGSKTHCGMDPVSVRGVATWVRYFVITGR